MTTLNSALNFNFASAEAARIAYADRGVEDTIAAQLKQAAANAQFQVGATVTARYQYKVAEDGSLVPTQTQITTTAPDDATRGGSGRKGQRQALRDGSDRRPTLGDLAKPKAELSPTDELSIFAASGEAPSPLSAQAAVQSEQDVSPSSPIAAEVLDENGQPVEAQLLRFTGGQAAPEKPASAAFSAQAQFTVAGLYARNSNVAYTVTPLASFAA